MKVFNTASVVSEVAVTSSVSFTHSAGAHSISPMAATVYHYTYSSRRKTSHHNDTRHMHYSILMCVFHIQFMNCQFDLEVIALKHYQMP